MVDNPAEKIDACLLIGVVEYCLRAIGTAKKCPLYGVVGCPLFKGCLCIELNGRTVGTFRITRYIMGVRFSGVSVKRCSTVHAYYNALASMGLTQAHPS